MNICQEELRQFNPVQCVPSKVAGECKQTDSQTQQSYYVTAELLGRETAQSLGRKPETSREESLSVEF